MSITIPPEIAHLSLSHIAARLGCTPTAVMYAKRRAAGLCERCKAESSDAVCAACETKIEESRRRRLGHKPWVKGQRGRPPNASI